MELKAQEVIHEYTDTTGVHHLVVSTGNTTGDVIEYVTVKRCPYCNRAFTESMVCRCSVNNAAIRL